MEVVLVDGENQEAQIGYQVVREEVVTESVEEEGEPKRTAGGTRRDEDAAPRAIPGSPPPTSEPEDELARLRSELEEALSRRLESHRRALLAENAGRVVPDLVAGATVEEMDASVARARDAFEAAKAAALAEMVASQAVAAGNGERGVPDLEGMSPMEKIAYGLRRE